jgi:hypothetical protein
MNVKWRPSIGTRRVLLLVFAVGVAWTAPPSASTPAPQKGGNKTVFAAAMDAENHPVTGMTKNEWGVREDGVDRTIVDIKPATQPLDIVLMVDTTKSIYPSITELRSALKTFGHTVLAGNPGANIAVMNVAAAATIIADNRKSPDDLDKALSRTFADQTQSTVFLEGMSEAAKKLMKSPSPRRAIVIVNLEGIPEGSTLQPPQVIQQIVQSGASMWAVSYSNDASRLLVIKEGGGAGAVNTEARQGGIGSGNTGQNRDLLLKNVPQGTGGFRVVIEVPTALEQTLNKLAAGLLAQYEVTYTRPEGPTPKLLQMGQVRDGVRISYPATPPK